MEGRQAGHVDVADLDVRGQIVIAVLADADHDELATSEIRDEAQNYDDSIRHNRQISRVLDSLEEYHAVSTQRGDASPPMKPPRLASLTAVGERLAEQITVTPVAVDTLDDVEATLHRTREELNDLETTAATGDDVDDLHGRLDILEEKIEAVEETATEAVDTAKNAEEVAADAVEAVANDIESQNRILDDYDVRLDSLDERIDAVRDEIGDAEQVAENLEAPSLAEAVDKNRSFIINLWKTVDIDSFRNAGETVFSMLSRKDAGDRE